MVEVERFGKMLECTLFFLDGKVVEKTVLHGKGGRERHRYLCASYWN